MITILVPCHNEAQAIPILFSSLKKALPNIDWELLIMDDGSADHTEQVIADLQAHATHITYHKLSPNRGQYEAIKAGIPYCKGDWVVIMDADGQDNPLMIPELYQKAISQDYDAVFAERLDKKYTSSKVIASIIFHAVLGLITNTKQNPRIAGFGIYKKKALEELAAKSPKLLYLPLMKQWQPYKTTTHLVVHQQRINGKSSYSFTKQLNLALKIFKSL